MPAKKVSSAAAALGRMAKGVPKNYTPEERERRRAAMQRINQEKKFVTGTVKVVEPAATTEAMPPTGPTGKVVAAGRPRQVVAARRFVTATIRA